MFKICITLLFLDFHWPSSGTGQDLIGCYQKGECLNSFLLGVGRTVTPSECRRVCSETEDCHYFTHYALEDVCFAHRDCIDLSADTCTDCTSGDLRCPDLQCNSPGQCTGTLSTFEIVDNVSSCKDQADCHFWTFDSTDGLCELFQDCVELVTGCGTCTSGEKMCSKGQCCFLLNGRCMGAAANQLGNTSSHTITEVKQRWARLVLGWETVQVLHECCC